MHVRKNKICSVVGIFENEYQILAINFRLLNARPDTIWNKTNNLDIFSPRYHYYVVKVFKQIQFYWI